MKWLNATCTVNLNKRNIPTKVMQQSFIKLWSTKWTMLKLIFLQELTMTVPSDLFEGVSFLKNSILK